MNPLKNARTKANLSLQDLGNLCGMSRAALCLLERPEANPTLKTAYKIARVLGESIYILFPDRTEIVEETVTVRRVATTKEPK
jgi:transcriptional regulator with XRE-family HTH domain